MLDHELCHCFLDEEDTPRLRPHDLEEFVAVVARHGYWRAEVERMASAMRPHQPPLLTVERTGRIVALEPAGLPLDQQ